MKHHNNIVMGLDIGCSKICATICDISSNGELGLRGIGISLSSGLRHGAIHKPDDLQHALEQAIRRAEREAGLKAYYTLANIPLFGMQFCHHEGLVMSKEASGQISEADRQEAIRRSKQGLNTKEQTVAHAIALRYKVDGKECQQPVGLSGRALEVYTHIILAHSDTLLTLTRLLKHLKLHVSGLVYDSLALSQLVLTDKERASQSLLFDIGGRFTKINMFKQQVLYKSALIPIGGDTFTYDVAQCLDISIMEAERLKIIHGDLCLSRINPQTKIDIKSKNGEQKRIKKQLLSQILEARAFELMSFARKAMPMAFEQPYPIIISGGGGHLKGLSEYLQGSLRHRIRDGLPESLRDIIENSSYLSAIGLVLYGLRSGSLTYGPDKTLSLSRQLKTWIQRLF